MVFTNEEIAIVAHEVNRAYCQALGDESQVSWDTAPVLHRESYLVGVRLHRSADTVTSPSLGHESWRAKKVAEGWTYGPVKDAEKKQHPCMMPFEQLPLEQQAKDSIFRAVVLAMCALELRAVPAP